MIDPVDDLSASPLGRRRRQMWLRVGVPIAGVLLVILAVLGITFYADRLNSAGALTLSDEVLTGLQARIAQQVENYLAPATGAAQLAKDMAGQKVINDRRAVLEAFATSVLRKIAQIDAFYVGDGDGNFMMVRRGANGGTDTKLIDNSPGARMVAWVRRDAAGKIVGTEPTPDDDYDPRTRAWYQGAMKTDAVFWTGVYTFFTTHSPGVTAAVSFNDHSDVAHVFGVDITLQDLSRFLASLKIGRSGRAVIFGGDGHLIAAPGTVPLRGEGTGLATAQLDQLGDAELTRAYDRYRVEGYGHRIISAGGEPIVSIAAPLPGAGRDWSMLIVVPEQDFIGFVAANGRRTLILSLGVVALAALLAALLVGQGLRADRSARLLLERSAQIERQSAAFATLAEQADLFDAAREAPTRELTETLAAVAAARRASVWRLSGNGAALRCEDAYDRERDGHVGGLELARGEMPQFFAALHEGKEIAVADAAGDRRTGEWYRALMQAVDSRALLVVPVMVAGSVVGAVMMEDAARLEESRDFLRAVANMLAVRMRGAPAAVTSPAASAPAAFAPAPPEPAAVDAGERNVAAELARRGFDLSDLSADVFASVAVLVMKFGYPSGPRPAALSALADGVARFMQEIAEAHDIPYMKLVGRGSGRRRRLRAGRRNRHGAGRRCRACRARSLHRAVRGCRLSARVPDRPRFRDRDRQPCRPRAAAVQSVGRGGAQRRRHGRHRRCARRRTGERGGLPATAAGVSVPPARQFLHPRDRSGADLRARRPAVSAHLQPRSSTRLRHVLGVIGGVTRQRAAFLLMLAALLQGVLREGFLPRSWRRTVRAEFRRSLRQSVGGGLATTLVTAILAGLAMVSQALYWLGLAGEETLAGQILVTVLVRELTPLLIGFVLLGRSGTVMVTELGRLQLGGQVRTLAGLGIDPFLFLVLPRAVALALASFTLGMVFALTALVIGFIAGSLFGAVQGSLWSFLDHVLGAMRPVDFAMFPAKMLLIGLLVALTACLTGLMAGSDDDNASLLPRGFVRGVLAVMLTSLLLSLAA